MNNTRTLTPFIFLAVAAVVFYGGVWQQLGAVQTLRTQVSSADAALAQARGGNDKQNKLVDAWKALDSGIKDRVDLGVPAKSDVPNLLVLLNNAAANSGLLVENINIVEAQKPTTSTQTTSSVTSSGATANIKPSQSILLTISTRGDYPAAKNFVEAIQREERIMDLQSVVISPFVTQQAQ